MFSIIKRTVVRVRVRVNNVIVQSLAEDCKVLKDIVLIKCSVREKSPSVLKEISPKHILL